MVDIRPVTQVAARATEVDVTASFVEAGPNLLAFAPGGHMLRDEASGLRAGVQPSGKSVRVSSSSVDLRRACPIDEKNDGPGALQAEARGDGELLLDETQPGSKMRGPLPRNIRVVRGKPTAAATIEPIGPAVRSARSYAIRLTLKFDDVDEKFADRGWMVGSAERVLAGFAPSTGAEAPTVGDVVGLAERNVVGIEGCVVGEGRPAASSIEQLRQELITAGYGVVVREMRECHEASCTTRAVVDWSSASVVVPAGWYAGQICGRHGFKACPTCGSTYVMSSATAAAPSAHCEVCGGTLIEWGGTKLWTVELVTLALRLVEESEGFKQRPTDAPRVSFF